MGDPVAVRRYLTVLRSHGPAGEVAARLFQAQRSSSEAKMWRPGGFGRRRRYAVKSEALAALALALTQHAAALHITWGWAEDATAKENLGPAWLFYADLPCGQVSFHSWERSSGPNYPGKWDGFPGASVERILQYCDGVGGEAERAK
jgi:hypothetical protein